MDQPTNEITKIGRTNRKNILEKIYPRLMGKSKSTQKKKKRYIPKITTNWSEKDLYMLCIGPMPLVHIRFYAIFGRNQLKWKQQSPTTSIAFFIFVLISRVFLKTHISTYVCVQYIFLPTSLCVSLVFISASSHSSSSTPSSSSRMSIHKASFEVLQFARRNERTATTTTKLFSKVK